MPVADGMRALWIGALAARNNLMVMQAVVQAVVVPSTTTSSKAPARSASSSDSSILHRELHHHLQPAPSTTLLPLKWSNRILIPNSIISSLYNSPFAATHTKSANTTSKYPPTPTLTSTPKQQHHLQSVSPLIVKCCFAASSADNANFHNSRRASSKLLKSKPTSPHFVTLYCFSHHFAGSVM